MDSQDKGNAVDLGKPTSEEAVTETPESQAPEPEAEPAAPAARLGGWLPVVVMGVAAVLCLALAAVFFVQRDNAADDASGGAAANSAYADTAETAAVSAAARDILSMIYTYGYDNIDGLAARIKPLMTDKMFGQYEGTSPPSSEMIKQAKTQVTAVIGDASVGVVSVTGDTAVAEVLLGIEGTNDGVAISKAQVPVRLTLQKVGGKWIASDIQPI